MKSINLSKTFSSMLLAKIRDDFSDKMFFNIFTSIKIGTYYCELVFINKKLKNKKLYNWEITSFATQLRSTTSMAGKQ